MNEDLAALIEHEIAAYLKRMMGNDFDAAGMALGAFMRICWSAGQSDELIIESVKAMLADRRAMKEAMH